MPKYVRVKHPDTKHEFDVVEDSVLLRNGHVNPVKGSRYPASPLPRPAKHHVKLAGQSAEQNKGTSSEAPSEATTSED